MNAMRYTSPNCIIFMFISVSGYMIEVRQLVGDEAIIQCPFPKESATYLKNFLRDGNGLSHKIIETASSESCISLGRYSFCNGAQSNEVTVTITIHNLTLEDAGDYRCCAKTGSVQETCHYISLDVHNQTTTTMTPAVPMAMPSENPQVSLTSTSASSLASSLSSSASTSESSSPPLSASLLPSPTSLLIVLTICVLTATIILFFVWYKHIKERQGFSPPGLPTTTTTTRQTTRPQGTGSGEYVNAQHTDIQVNSERGQSVCSWENARSGTGEDNPDYVNPPGCVRSPDLAPNPIPHHTPTPTLSLSPIPSSTSCEPLYQSLNPIPTPEEVDYLSLHPTTSISVDYLSPHPGVTASSTSKGSPSCPSYLSLDSHHTSLSDTIYDSLQ